MSQPGPARSPIPLPAPLRILDADTYDQAVTAADVVARRRGTGSAAVWEITAAVLTTVGIFPPPPDVDELDAECCTALCLAWEAEAVDADFLGTWHQCGDEPGHDGTDHDNGEFAWRDGQPGTMPPLTTGV